jgi:hypothetical protein
MCNTGFTASPWRNATRDTFGADLESASSAKHMDAPRPSIMVAVSFFKYNTAVVSLISGRLGKSF